MRLAQGFRQIALQYDAGLRVHGGERFVEQQHVRIDGERARQRHALAHAARQLVRVVAGKLSEVEFFKERLRAASALG